MKPGTPVRLGNSATLFAVVDEQDYARVADFGWGVNSRGYASRNTYTPVGRQRREILMHRLILDAPDGFDVDHANGDRLDNRRSNIRICTRSQNCANRRNLVPHSSRFKGVYWKKGQHRWAAGIGVQGGYLHLGYFSDEVLAAHAYDAAARKHFAEFAAPNFPLAEDAHVGN